MAIEIERKFLVVNDAWRQEAQERGIHMIQGYFEKKGVGVAPPPTVRVRIAGTHAFLTIKGRASGISRSEFEYSIPISDANAMIREFCGERLVEKIRYTFPAGNGLFWEVDEYLKLNIGLFTAEIELPSEDCTFVRPDWIGEEISGNPRYTNGALSRYPYSIWKQ